MRIKRAVTIAAISMFLAACGGHSNSPSPSHTPTPLTSVAAQLGCTYKRFGPPEELYTLESGTCGPYLLYSFASAQAKASWLDVSKDYVVVYKQGEDWLAVNAP